MIKKAPIVDSHCHLHSLSLDEFGGDMDVVMTEAHEHGVSHMLCVCVEPEDVPQLYALAERYADVSISVGIHPTTVMPIEWNADTLYQQATHSSCIAIGETGLDYYRAEMPEIRECQQHRFREHIRAALLSSKPLIVHTRQAADDTIRILAEEQADKIGGVMHCFSEDWDVAKRALDLNFYISFSGIVTFKNADSLRDVAKKMPIDRLLIETDSPYLAPVPFRGKQNRPAWVAYVAEALSALRGMEYAEFAAQTTDNFYRCFRKTPVSS